MATNEFKIGDIVKFTEEFHSYVDPQGELFRYTVGVVEKHLGAWGYYIHWPLEGFSTGEKARHLVKVGHVDE